MKRLSRVFSRSPSEQKAEQVAAATVQTNGTPKPDSEPKVNGVSNGVPPENSPRIVEERPIDESRPMRVVIIGSGISGIISSIRLRQRISKLDLRVYEKNADIGGTWLENRYPGCACGESAAFHDCNLLC